MQDILRTIPSVDQLLLRAQADLELPACQRQILVDAIRKIIESTRREILAGAKADVTLSRLLQLVEKEVQLLTGRNLKQVINAAGIIIHTGLGRAPLSSRAKTAVEAAMAGYSALEFDLQQGIRGERNKIVEEKLCALTGAEAALVVNNNAAAVLLVLSTLAAGQEVIISRGQLVEIGGAFRIPEVLRQSGACLVEVGTTNRTHMADYAEAITPQTAGIMKVHTSNYRIVGFAAQPEDAQLVELAKERSLISINDLGSGTLLPLEINGYQEQSVSEAVNAGFDIITFSGDKLLGGGQAGIILGKEKYLNQLKKNHLLRALRMDKLCLAALEGTLQDYIIGGAETEVPVQYMLRIKLEELQKRAVNLTKMLSPLIQFGWKVETIELRSWAGGGALPAVELQGYGVCLCAKQIGLNASRLEKFFRERQLPIIVRIHNDKIVIDVRCLMSGDENEIFAACQEAGKEIAE